MPSRAENPKHTTYTVILERNQLALKLHASPGLSKKERKRLKLLDRQLADFIRTGRYYMWNDL